MAAAGPVPLTSINKRRSTTTTASFSKHQKFIPTFNLPSNHNAKKCPAHLYLRVHGHGRRLHLCNVISTTDPSTISTQEEQEQGFVSRFAPDEPRKGCDVLVEALEREGVTCVFAYPGGSSVEIHQALTRSKIFRNVLPRHEQGGVFAAEGYACACGEPGVSIATSGPGATNLVSGLADAMMDSIPMVAITGQVPRRMIGADAFQETPFVVVTRPITKHNYLVLDVEDIPRIVKEAFYLAKTGRPGPVLIDIPKDIQQQLVVPNWEQPMSLDG